MKIFSMDKNSITAYITSSICWFFGLLTLEKWAVVIGIICTVSTFFYNIYHKQQVRKLLKKKKWIDDEEID